MSDEELEEAERPGQKKAATKKPSVEPVVLPVKRAKEAAAAPAPAPAAGKGGGPAKEASEKTRQDYQQYYAMYQQAKIGQPAPPAAAAATTGGGAPAYGYPYAYYGAPSPAAAYYGTYPPPAPPQGPPSTGYAAYPPLGLQPPPGLRPPPGFHPPANAQREDAPKMNSIRGGSAGAKARKLGEVSTTSTAPAAQYAMSTAPQPPAYGEAAGASYQAYAAQAAQQYQSMGYPGPAQPPAPQAPAYYGGYPAYPPPGYSVPPARDSSYTSPQFAATLGAPPTQKNNGDAAHHPPHAHQPPPSPAAPPQGGGHPPPPGKKPRASLPPLTSPTSPPETAQQPGQPAKPEVDDACMAPGIHRDKSAEQLTAMVKKWVSTCLKPSTSCSESVKHAVQDFVRKKMPPKSEWANIDWARKPVPTEVLELVGTGPSTGTKRPRPSDDDDDDDHGDTKRSQANFAFVPPQQQQQQQPPPLAVGQRGPGGVGPGDVQQQAKRYLEYQEKERERERRERKDKKRRRRRLSTSSEDSRDRSSRRGRGGSRFSDSSSERSNDRRRRRRHKEAKDRRDPEPAKPAKTLPPPPRWQSPARSSSSAQWRQPEADGGGAHFSENEYVPERAATTTATASPPCGPSTPTTSYGSLRVTTDEFGKKRVTRDPYREPYRDSPGAAAAAAHANGPNSAAPLPAAAAAGGAPQNSILPSWSPPPGRPGGDEPPPHGEAGGYRGWAGARDEAEWRRPGGKPGGRPQFQPQYLAGGKGDGSVVSFKAGGRDTGDDASDTTDQSGTPTHDAYAEGKKGGKAAAKAQQKKLAKLSKHQQVGTEWGADLRKHEEPEARRQRLSRFEKPAHSGPVASPVSPAVSSPPPMARTPKPQRQFYSTPSSLSIADPFTEDDHVPIVGECQDLEKVFTRSAAGLEHDPKTVRPLHVLKQALPYVLSQVSKKTSPEIYIYEQLKSIRQDLTVQHIFNDFTTYVYEIHARLCLDYADLGEFNACQAKLKAFHKRPDMVVSAENVHEFAAYRIMYCCLTKAHEQLASELVDLPEAILRLPIVRHSLSLLTALVPLNVELFDKCYNATPNKGKLLIDMFLPPPRGLRMKMYLQMCKAYRPSLPLAHVKKCLLFREPDGEGLPVDSKKPDPATFEGFIAYVKAVRVGDNELDTAKSVTAYHDVLKFLDERRDFTHAETPTSANQSPSPPPFS
ncbi:SAC3 family protein A [Diplonema papillatum]|nr:SAC3 family protein A [Diplonema papillatum]